MTNSLARRFRTLREDVSIFQNNIEVQISRAVAQAAQQLTTQNMAQAAQQEGSAKSKIHYQMQMQELALKGEEQKRKAAKDAV